MIPFIKSLLWDDAAFQRYARVLLFALGAMVQNGSIPTGVEGGGKYGMALQFLALLISSTTKAEPKV